MFTCLSRTLIGTVVLASALLLGTSAAVAQTPQTTPRPTPVPNSPSAPPGQPNIPGSTTPTNPTAPPGSVQQNPTAPPGALPSQTPAATPVPGTPVVPGGSTQPDVNGPIREPVIPQFQAKPIPPPPNLDRLGIGSENLTEVFVGFCQIQCYCALFPLRARLIRRGQAAFLSRFCRVKSPSADD